MFKVTPGQFKYIVSQTPQGVFGQFLAVVLVSPLFLRIGFPEHSLYLWDVCAVLLLAYRYLSYRRWYRGSNSGSNPPGRAAITNYVAPLFFLGMLWAALFTKILQQPSTEMHMLAMVVGMGLILLKNSRA
jgi:hypothetical protein